MDIAELFKNLPIGGFLRDVLVFVLSPRRYLKKVNAEPDFTTVQRLCFYAVCFSVFEFAVIGVGLPAVGSPTKLEILGVAVFEVMFGMIYIPAFVAVGMLERTERPLKNAIAYSLTFRFVYITVPLVLYALFLTTESYGIALVRGVATYIYWVAWILVLPLASTRSIRLKAGGALLSLGFAVLLFYALDTLVEGNGGSSKRLAQLSILYDPIGNEVDAARVNFDVLDNAPAIRRTIDGLGMLSDIHRPDSVAALSAVTKAWNEWPAASVMEKDKLAKERLRLAKLDSTATFETTRQAIELQLALVDSTEKSIEAIDRLRALKTSRLGDLFDAFLAAQNAQIRGLRWVVENVSFRRKLADMGLLICQCAGDY
ncbi:MAG: hypothetical protein JWL97_726 [Gemmatimonadales bacterium]|nr:hypothetical protein [Gemmatimonadales bacterium]